MGRTVGTVTLILVAAGSPPMLPSAVDESVTDEVPVPPEASTVLAAEAEMARDAIMQIRDEAKYIYMHIDSNSVGKGIFAHTLTNNIDMDFVVPDYIRDAILWACGGLSL